MEAVLKTFPDENDGEALDNFPQGFLLRLEATSRDDTM